MSSFNFKEKALLEGLFEMDEGYVLDFSNNSFRRFFADHETDIYSDKYSEFGESKANRLRSYWQIEDDSSVAIILKELIERKRDKENRFGPSDKVIEDKLAEAEQLVTRLTTGEIDLNPLKEKATVLDLSHMSQQIKRIEKAVTEDPALAIGTAKELIETTCKTILRERGKPVSGSPDISNLTKDTLKELKLVPEGIPDNVRGKDTIKRLLSNLGTIGNGLAELRGMYGTGHGKDGNSAGLRPRHARLAAGAATTLAMFLFETHTETKDNDQ